MKKKIIIPIAALLMLTSCTAAAETPASTPADTESVSNPGEYLSQSEEASNSFTVTSDEACVPIPYTYPIGGEPLPPEETMCFSGNGAAESTTEDLSLYCILTETPSFDTPEEYYNSGDEMPYCYILKNPPKNAELKDISYNWQSYVTAHYYIPLDEKYENEELSEYNIERMTTIVCEHTLSENVEESFKINILDKLDTNGYEKIEINGREYYYKPEYDSLYNQERIIGYEIEFLEDGERMFLHLPPLDSIENMAEYLEVIKA